MRQVVSEDSRHHPALKERTGKRDVMIPSDRAVLTLRQQLWTPPCRLVRCQLIISAELFIQPPSPLPPSMLRIRTLLAPRSSPAGAFGEPGCGVYWYPDHFNDLQCGYIPINQVKVRHFTKLDLHLLHRALSWVGGFARPFHPCAQTHSLWTSF